MAQQSATTTADFILHLSGLHISKILHEAEADSTLTSVSILLWLSIMSPSKHTPT